MNLDLRALIGKLNHETKGAVEAAAGLCLSRTHYDVEVEHYLMKLLDQTDGDLAAILKHYGVDRSRLATELTRSLDRLKSGNARNPSLSPTLVRMLSEAWTLGSVNFGASQVRTGHTVVALATDTELEPADAGGEPRVPEDCTRRSAQGIRQHRGEFHRGGRRGRRAARRRSTPHSRRQDAEPGPVHRQPHREGQARQNRPGPGPRFRDPPGRGHPHAPAAEQSDPHRRGRRRQDGRGGRLRHAHRRRRRAAAAARTSRCARSTWRCCRRARASKASSRTASRG